MLPAMVDTAEVDSFPGSSMLVLVTSILPVDVRARDEPFDATFAWKTVFIIVT
jgi:hypothetical protein